MPFYIYRCEACREEFEIRHGMFYVQEKCIKCNGSDCLFKVPSFSTSKKEEELARKPGELIEEYMKDAKEEIKKEKKKLKSEEF